MAAAAFLNGSHWCLICGAFLGQIRFFLDCTDGKLARLVRKTSRFGLALDHFTDIVAFVLMFSMLGLGQWRTNGLVIFLFLAGFFIVTSFYDRLTSSWLELFLGEEASDSMLEAKTRIKLFSWLKKHRLSNFPSTVEAETLALFFGPMLNQVLIGFVLGLVLMLFHNLKNTYKLFTSLGGG